jgi:hypothetical protein
MIDPTANMSPSPLVLWFFLQPNELLLSGLREALQELVELSKGEGRQLLYSDKGYFIV